jgi:hypothetical protein
MSLLQKAFCTVVTFPARVITDYFCQGIWLGGNSGRRFFLFSTHYSLAGVDFGL